MLTPYRITPRGFEPMPWSEGLDLDQQATWVDLLQPSGVEEQAVEHSLGLDIPTREEVQEIEASSRLYKEQGALFMTATVIYQADTPRPKATSVTFVLTAGRLVTLRYDDLTPFKTFLARQKRGEPAMDNGMDILLGLLDVIVDRAADILEKVGEDMDAVSHAIFDNNETDTGKSRPDALKNLLRAIGRSGDILSKASESLVSLARLLGFLGQACDDKPALEKDGRLEILNRDVKSLTGHADTLSEKADFLLAATLGMINIEQTRIIKIFSVAAVIFLPPTLVASIYGMNFDFMPELDWLLGYPFAVLLMIIAAVLPYWIFKRRGWL